MRSFEITVNIGAPSTGAAVFAGTWADDLGCRSNRVATLTNRTTGLPAISIESLACTDGDFVLSIRSGTANTLTGVCNRGPNCTFTMTRH